MPKRDARVVLSSRSTTPAGGSSPAAEAVRLDTWLWTARIVKTRTLASDAAKGGRVRLNGQAAKPGKEVGPGDRLEISLGQTRLAVVVRGCAPRRVSAAEAAALYEESPDSVAARLRAAELRRLAGPAQPQGGARPTKRDRRRMERERPR